MSEDAPRFHTEIRAAHLQVVELPKDEPFIQIDKKNISNNDSFKAVCFVGKSYPAANITWYINGEKVIFSEIPIYCIWLLLLLHIGTELNAFGTCVRHTGHRRIDKKIVAFHAGS